MPPLPRAQLCVCVGVQGVHMHAVGCLPQGVRPAVVVCWCAAVFVGVVYRLRADVYVFVWVWAVE